VNRLFLFRLFFDLLAAALLLFSLAYWWLGNTAHELAGTAMFLLLIVHNVFNRRWYGSVPQTRKEPRALLNVGITAALLAGMLALLMTSILISNALAGVVPSWDGSWGGFTARQIHTFAAYWVLVIVAIHLGLRWPLIMNVARNRFGVMRPSAARTLVLRVVAAAIAICGVWSSFALDIGTRLAMQVTLDWWNFEEAVAGFFVHTIAIVGLYIVATYYAMNGLRRWTRPAAAVLN